MKENVFIGKLIPAGTGMKNYRNTYLDTDANMVGTIDFPEEVIEEDFVQDEAVSDATDTMDEE